MGRIITILTLVTAFSLLSVNKSNAQCNAMDHKDKCISGLADGFTFIKSYLLDGGKANANGEIEYSFVFSKGTIYMLNIANNNGEQSNIVIKLYDPNHKLLASNNKGDVYFPLGYQCKTTGVHYMTFSFKDTPDQCGLSVLGFKR